MAISQFLNLIKDFSQNKVVRMNLQEYSYIKKQITHFST